MAETKQLTQKEGQREYVIPLRKDWIKAARYKRARKSVMTVKAFIARHMKIPERNLQNVRIDSYLNNELWFRGARKPPAKIKVIARKDGELVRVELAEIPEIIKFRKARHEKRHKKAEKKKVESKEETGGEDKTTKQKSEEEKKEEEKEKSVEKMHEKIAEKAARTQKHTTQSKTPTAHRKALKK